MYTALLALVNVARAVVGWMKSESPERDWQNFFLIYYPFEPIDAGSAGAGIL